MKSVIQKERECYFCGIRTGLHRHHFLYGSSNRRNAERRGFVVFLCARHHTLGSEAVHRNPNGVLDRHLKEVCQRYYEAEYGDREAFIKEFGRNYL